MLRVVAIVLSTFLFATFATTAQNTISLASNISRAGQSAPLSCQREAAVLAQELVDFPHPEQWHWVIVCDDAGWRQFLMQGDRSAAEPGTSENIYSSESIYGSTDLAARVTFLRGSTLLKPDNPDARPDHVIAHELAHIILRTADEGRAERQALLWLREQNQHSSPGSGGLAMASRAR